MRRMFVIDADVIEQRDFELIHIYIRKTLDKKNRNMVIKSYLIEDALMPYLQVVMDRARKT